METNQYNQEQDGEAGHETRTHRSHIPDISKPVNPAPIAPAAANTSTVPPKKSKKLPLKGIVVSVVVVLFVALAAFGAWSVYSNRTVPVDENKNISQSDYQALFLTNGQVYFGHLSNLDHKYVTISDIYYLQVQQNLQQGAGGNTNSQVSLAKLGSELHGPQDKMFIASDQVLFWENLKSDSKVTQAIKAYKQQ